MDPKKGGTVLVLAYDVQSLDFQYLDPVLNEWVDSWDSTQPTGQMDRLPLQVRIELVVAGADNGAPLHYVTKVPLAMQAPLSFGLPR
jgi:general secretion pathway protein J